MMIALYIVMLIVFGIAGIFYGIICLVRALEELHYAKIIEQHKKKDGD